MLTSHVCLRYLLANYQFVTIFSLVLPVKNANIHQDQQVNCLLEIVKHHLLSQQTTIIYETQKMNPNRNALSDKTITILVDNIVPIIILEDLNYVNTTENFSLLILVFIKNCKFLLDNNIDFKVGYLYLIIIEDYYNSECEKILKANLPYTFDVTFFVYDFNKEEYIFLATIPEIDETNCNMIVTINAHMMCINSCNNSSLVQKGFRNIFPPKILRNYKKCPLKVGMATLYPYSIIKNKENLNNLDPIKEIKGSDFEALKIITETVNASLDIYYIFRDEENPYLHMEYLDYLLNGSLNACAGGLYRIYGDVVDYSGIYSKQAVIWTYYAERDIRSWQSLIRKINGLYYFFIFYICHSFVWALISLVNKETVSFIDTLLYSWGALIGASSLQDARSIKKKILNIVYLTMCLHLSAYISAQMYSYLTIQNPPQMYKTSEELSNSDKRPYLEFATKFFIEDSKYEQFANTSENCDSFSDCIESVFKNKGSTIILDSYLLPVQASTAVNDEAKILGVPGSILFVYHEMIIQKNSPIVSKFIEVIEKLFEAGIFQKLYNDAIGITVVDKAEIANRNTMSDSYSCTVGCEITFSQSAGAFYIWFFGCVLSCCVFALENWFGRISNT